MSASAVLNIALAVVCIVLLVLLKLYKRTYAENFAYVDELKRAADSGNDVNKELLSISVGLKRENSLLTEELVKAEHDRDFYKSMAHSIDKSRLEQLDSRPQEI